MTTNVRWYWIALGFLAAIAIAPASCAKNNSGGGGIPTVSPSGSPTGSPGPCFTMNPNSAGNLVIVDMSSAIGATTAPTYGPIAGYGVDDDGFPPSYAQVINHWYPSTAISPSPKPITASNILQFANTDNSEVHSAVGFSGNKFPSTPYAFPTADASPSANTVIGNGSWSTGLITAAGSGSASFGECFSQTFTLKAGTYYFGDYSYYNTLTSFRDVLVVSAAGAHVHRSRDVRRRRPPAVLRQ